MGRENKYERKRSTGLFELRGRQVIALKETLSFKLFIRYFHNSLQ